MYTVVTGLNVFFDRYNGLVHPTVSVPRDDDGLCPACCWVVEVKGSCRLRVETHTVFGGFGLWTIFTEQFTAAIFEPSQGYVPPPTRVILTRLKTQIESSTDK